MVPKLSAAEHTVKPNTCASYLGRCLRIPLGMEEAGFKSQFCPLLVTNFGILIGIKLM